MDSNDFYEDDETIDELHESWRVGEPGVTAGPNALDDLAQATAEQAATALNDSVAAPTVIRATWYVAPGPGLGTSATDRVERQSTMMSWFGADSAGPWGPDLSDACPSAAVVA